MWSFIYRALRKEAVASWRGGPGISQKWSEVASDFYSARKLAFLSRR